MNGVTFIARGSSHSKAIKNSILNSVEAVRTEMISKIGGAVSCQ